MKMRLEDFKNLFDNEQLRIIFSQAKFVDSMEKDRSVYALYSMKTFFIELKYDISKFDISSTAAFESDHRLNKYLNWNTAIKR